MWLMRAAPVIFDTESLQKQVVDFRTAVTRDSDIDKRFTLLSKLFARAFAIPSGEEGWLLCYNFARTICCNVF